jgi:hypothetical protein
MFLRGEPSPGSLKQAAAGAAVIGLGPIASAPRQPTANLRPAPAGGLSPRRIVLMSKRLSATQPVFRMTRRRGAVLPRIGAVLSWISRPALVTAKDRVELHLNVAERIALR